MKKYIFIIATILLPLISMGQKGKHFEFNYLALELGSQHCFNKQPEPNMNFYYQSEFGKIHLTPVQGSYYTPGFNVGLQFHHDFMNDKHGIISGLMFNSWGQSAKYQSDNKKVTLNETQRVSSIGIPLYVKMGQQIYNQQCYFYMGTQVDINFKLITQQKVNGIDGTHRTDIYKDALNKINIPIIIGFNYTIINFRLGIQPQDYINHDYEYELPNGDIIKPFEGRSKLTIFGNFGFLIPLSQWTTKRSYILSRIF